MSWQEMDGMCLNREDVGKGEERDYLFIYLRKPPPAADWAPPPGSGHLRRGKWDAVTQCGGMQCSGMQWIAVDCSEQNAVRRCRKLRPDEELSTALADRTWIS